ncbi:LCP family glycopolymer transferase [Thermoflavimicrobium dichotomicum]|uniref:Cell envelope-related function transcriptional attenuator common domain-containing protein n=1 Tax=Thermoflavimicrobium dichotomicum TaxID=46223 RepID=A0A1I3T8D2_9BACL|nr:LCP family protein [Thermoflavimicrobium dichotomicum]SFJ66569.1 cell envelope-related function transcriptional attenuator common domain-containing protein [Thermoflavimicrobium dichotomicum]
MAKPSSARKKAFRVLGVLLAILLVIIIYYGYVFYRTANQAYDPPKQAKSDKRSQEVNFSKDPISILLLGIDQRPGDVGRADTIIYMTLNPKQEDIYMTNIPRDTLVYIPGYHHDKINHSYAFGGVDLTKKTVEQFLDLPIDGYVKVNMQGLKSIVDALGGVEVEVPFDFSYHGSTFHKGKMHVNGKQALAFVQMRKEDPEGDTGRNKRQQEMIRAIIHKGTQFSSLTRLDDVMEQVGTHVRTDLSPWKVFTLQQQYRAITNQEIKSLSFHTIPITRHGIFYWTIGQEEVRRVRAILAKHLELSGSQS